MSGVVGTPAEVLRDMDMVDRLGSIADESYHRPAGTVDVVHSSAMLSTVFAYLAGFTRLRGK